MFLTKALSLPVKHIFFKFNFFESNNLIFKLSLKTNPKYNL